MKQPNPTPRTRIRELRKARGFTQKELGLLVGTTPQTIQRLETAEMTVSLEWLEKIGAALGVQTHELLPRPDLTVTPERAFLMAVEDAVIHSRRHAPGDDLALLLAEQTGKLFGVILECGKGLRPWEDAQEKALAVAAIAMRVGVDMAGWKAAPKRMENAA
jgi:transcriptional regulator with XRE-family HTH domain